MSAGPARRAATLAAMVLVLAAPAAGADPAPRFTDGAASFQSNCAVCHRATGAGTPGLAPPVTVYPPRFAVLPAGRRQLVLTVLFGMYGDVVVADRHYNFKMPDFGRLEDAALAATLNFVVFDLGSAAAALPPFTAAEIAAERGQALDGDAVRVHRAEVVAALPP